MKILVIGASARAASQSVYRAGHEAAALDLFVDRDLREIADCESIREYPESIVEQAKRWPDHAILLGGGMENFPDVVAELEKGHTIVGPNASQIRRLRSLENWQSWVAELGIDDWLRFPTTRAVGELGIESSDSAFLDGLDGWLVKSRRSAGGLQVFSASPTTIAPLSDAYLQRYVPGPVLGVSFSCTENQCSILAVMRNLKLSELHLDEKPSSTTTPNLYAGSVGPYFMASETQTRLENWVQKIASSIGYRGVLQADFIHGDDGYLYLLEWNPRWTASMELIEMCFKTNLVEEQLRLQFKQADFSAPRLQATEWGSVQAQKRILYATREIRISSACSDAMMARSNWWTNPPSDMSSVAGWADIPPADTPVEVGSPIATIWAIRSRSRHTNELSAIDASSSSFDRWLEIDELLKTFAQYCL